MPLPRFTTAALAAAAVLALAACSTSSSGKAAADASSAMANPTVSAELSGAEQQLLTNLQADFRPAHPVKSVQAAIKATYPQGNTGKIETFAVKTFTLPVIHTKGPGSPRDRWLQGVVTYAETQGAGAAASPGASMTPAATFSPAPSPSTTGATS